MLEAGDIGHSGHIPSRISTAIIALTAALGPVPLGRNGQPFSSYFSGDRWASTRSARAHRSGSFQPGWDRSSRYRASGYSGSAYRRSYSQGRQPSAGAASASAASASAASASASAASADHAPQNVRRVTWASASSWEAQQPAPVPDPVPVAVPAPQPESEPAPVQQHDYDLDAQWISWCPDPVERAQARELVRDSARERRRPHPPRGCATRPR